MRYKNILEITDFSQKEFIHLIKEAIAYKKNMHRNKTLLHGKRVCLLFDSSSLRTRLSFESAVRLLGGSTYFIDSDTVLHEKDGTPREVYEDIIDTIDRMVDAYVVRDYSQNMLEVLKRKQYPPIINGFCQTGHPSQSLADLSVITWKKGAWKLNYVGVCPPEGSGVMESFVYAVLLLGQNITLITPTGEIVGKNLGFHKTVKMLSKYGGKLCTTKYIHSTMKTADVLYVDEWWENKKDFLKRQIGTYQVNKAFLKNAKKDLAILHCLPAHPDREIAADVMRSSPSIIFDQAEFRVYSAMSLLSYLFEE